jgi:peptidoglycan/LPS O-acetylase OafA/YrhL
MYALGLISYSLYLYHPFAEHLPGALKIWPVEVASSIALATGSYLIVEKPFLKLKDRLSRASRQVPVSATR